MVQCYRGRAPKKLPVLSRPKVSHMLHSYGGMPIKLLIMEHPINLNSSLPQAVFQCYQQRSESSWSLDGQRGKHAVSGKNCDFLCYLPTQSVVLWKSVKQRTPQREPYLKVRKILDFTHAIFVTPCSFAGLCSSGGHPAVLPMHCCFCPHTYLS